MPQESTGQRERQLYIAAAKISCASQREDYLAEACKNDLKLLRRIKTLLAAKFARKEEPENGNLLQSALQTSSRGDGDESSTKDMQLVTPVSQKIDGLEYSVEKHLAIDRYELVEEIGRGGMGTVYLAQQTDPVRRRVAVKVINPGMDSREVLARFEAERQALALMDHPNIARVFDGGTTDLGLPYFVMELVCGVPLTEYCQVKQLSLKDRLGLFVDVCGAVQHAHQKGIIHRDLKPSNLLAAELDEKTLIKVIDFGVAKALDQDLTEKPLFTRFSTVIGTPVYMSPEQTLMSGVDVDIRSDIYSLGVVLYELLTGTTPFDRETLARVGLDEFRRMVAEKEPGRPSSRTSALRESKWQTKEDDRQVSLRTKDNTVSAELDWIVLKSLEKDRERRYESAKAFADDIRRFLRGEAVLACPPTIRYRTSKFFARHRVAVGIGVFAFAALNFLVVMSIWQVRQVKQAWMESQTRERQATDLLEAIQLQSSVSAFRQSDFLAIPELLGPNAASSRLISNQSSPGFFQSLLVNASNPAFDLQVSIDGEIVDCAWDRTRECAWILAGNGNLYCLDESAWHNQSDLENLAPAGSVGRDANAIAVSPSGDRLMIGDSAGQLSLWSLGEQTRRLRQIQIGLHSVESIVWSPDGKYVVAGTRYEAFWVGQADGETVFQALNDHRHEAFVFHPGSPQGDSMELLVPTREGISIYGLPDGTKRRTIALGQYGNAREFQLAGTKRNWLVTCETSKQSMLVIDVKNGKRLGTVPLKSKYPSSITVMNNGRWIVALFPSGLLQIVSLNRQSDGQVGSQPIAAFYTDASHVDVTPAEVTESPSERPRLRVLVSSDQTALVTTATRGAIRRWDINRVLPILSIRPPSALLAAYAMESNELDFFFRRGFKQKDDFCDRVIPRGLAAPSFRGIGEVIHRPLVCFSRQVSDSGWIACAGPKHVTIYDLVNRKVVRTLPTTQAFVRGVEISPNGDSVAIHGGGDGGAMAWHSDDGWQTATKTLDFEGVVDGIFCFAEKEGQSCLIWDESSSRIHELDNRDRTQRVVLEQSSETFEVATVSDDGQLLALGGRSTIKIVDLKTGRVRFETAELSAVHGLGFLPGNRVLLSGHESKRVRAWHVPTGQALGVLVDRKFQSGIPTHFMVFPDQNRLLVNFQDDVSVAPLVLGTGASAR